MKRFLLTTIIYLMHLFSYAQNLVPNPSFEDTVYCPFGLTQLEACSFWMNFGNSPDYFNECATNGVNIPNSVFGFQYTHSGTGIIGVATFREPNSPDGPNYREFIGVELTHSLLIGEKYYFSFYTNYSHYHPFQAIASNNIGLSFLTTLYDSCCHPPLVNFAQLYSTAVIIDSINWIRLSGSFIADSTYSYLSIGNFFDDAHTDTIELSSFPDAAYYYVDDVCVTTDSLYNELWTATNLIASNLGVSIFPNPSYDYIDLISSEIIERIEAYDVSGRLIFENSPMNCSYRISSGNLSQGVYLVRIKINNIYVNERLIKLTR